MRRNLQRYRHRAPQAECTAEELRPRLPEPLGHLARLAQVVENVVDRPLLPGNRIELLVNGEETYPAMREALAVWAPVPRTESTRNARDHLHR